MKEAIHVAAVTLVFVLAPPLCGQEALTPYSKEVSTIIIAEQTKVRLGEPVKIAITIRNKSQKAITADANGTVFDCLEIKGSDGQRLPYVGFTGQIGYIPVLIAPSSTNAIAEHFDLTDNYVFPKPGRYSIRYRNSDPSGFPESNTISVDITPGQMSDVEQTVLHLLAMSRPKGWYVTKSPRVQTEVRPAGRSPEAGHYAHVMHDYMRGEAVLVWVTKTEAPIDPNPANSEYSLRMLRSEHLGRTRGMHVYIAQDTNAPAVWPTAITDISRALKIVKE